MYNGKYIPPTIRVKPGDMLKPRLVNRFKNPETERTNLQTHGWKVSPRLGSDTILMQIGPDERFDYSIHVPEDHPHAFIPERAALRTSGPGIRFRNRPVR